MVGASCNEHPPEVFFPRSGAGVAAAKKICAGCPVQPACLAFALDTQVGHGVWAGASERERRRILQARKLAARAGD